MPNSLNVTKGLSTEVQVTIAGSPEVHGNFFLADHAKSHYGEETLLDRGGGEFQNQLGESLQGC